MGAAVGIRTSFPSQSFNFIELKIIPLSAMVSIPFITDNITEEGQQCHHEFLELFLTLFLLL